MPAAPFFSVVVPTYNRANFLEKTLRSLLNQSFQNFEIIVVDDGSTDNTESHIQKIDDTRVRYYKKQNGGVSSARNYGLQFAKGDFINFFDSDDIAYPNHLEEANKYIEGKPLAKIIMFDFEWGDAERKNVKEVIMRFGDPNKAILHSNYPSTNCVFLHKDVFKELRFNESLSISEDWELWIKCSVRYKFHLGRVKTSYFIDHGERSVRKFNFDHVANQTKLLLNSLRQDKLFYPKNRSVLKRIQAHMFSYIAIHAAIKANKTQAISYFLKSLWLDPKSLFSKRSFAIIKHLSFSW
jgi:glycosyltransferase involved in cell wall biosynthesis